jgi:Bacterial regulatory proteins, tetR family
MTTRFANRRRWLRLVARSRRIQAATLLRIEPAPRTTAGGTHEAALAWPCPVSARNTSSNVGLCIHTSVAVIPAVCTVRSAERREQILLAATQAFARSGFAGTSLDDVAAEAGINKVYRHFESKIDLYQTVLDRVQRLLTTHVSEPVGGVHRDKHRRASRSSSGSCRAPGPEPSAE